jgi:hypothetical protein
MEDKQQLKYLDLRGFIGFEFKFAANSCRKLHDLNNWIAPFSYIINFGSKPSSLCFFCA